MTELRAETERVALVVDDEAVVRRITARTLSQAGFRVLEAGDGVEALDLLATLGTNVVSLVISDIVMPRMTGEQLAETIAQKWPKVQLILLSAEAAPRDRFAGSFLQKPVRPETLLTAVSALRPPPEASLS